MLQLRAKSTKQIFLVGISAGAVGAAQLAGSLADKLDGLALLFGSHPAARSLKPPILFIYGKSDERFPLRILTWIAESTAKQNPRVTIEAVAGGHFFALQDSDQFSSRFGAWLTNESTRTPHISVP